MADVFKPSEEQTKGLKPFERVKATAQVMFADTTLLEPAYREMVILYTPQPSDDKPTLWQRWLRRPKNALQRRFKRRVPKEGGAKEREKEGGEAGSEGKLQLNMYKDIPIPELKVVFPDKKLSYRLLDTVRCADRKGRIRTTFGFVFGLDGQTQSIRCINQSDLKLFRPRPKGRSFEQVLT